MAALALLLLLAALTPHAARAAGAAPAPAAAPEKAPATPSTPTTQAPSDLAGILSRHGCGSFAGLLRARPDVLSTFENVIMGGLTVFCPTDHAVAAFATKYKNLTAEGKEALLLYHGMPVYYSLATLRAGNGVMNTLATDGTSKNYNVTIQDDGDQLAVKTPLTTTSISGTAFDDRQYLAVYTIGQVLQPVELFMQDLPPAPAPKPSHKPKDKNKNKTHEIVPPPADSPDSGVADDSRVADDSSVIALSTTAQVAAAIAAAMIIFAA